MWTVKAWYGQKYSSYFTAARVMVYQSRGETFSTADKELQLGNNNFTVFFDFNPFTRVGIIF